MHVCPQCGTRFTEPVAFCPHDGTPTQLMEEAPPPDPLLGRVIDGRYRVEKAIGEGGMGIVYLITHAVLGKRMALKVLRGDMARDADVVQRFMQEAQSATQIGHPNIIDISDFGRLPDGSVYFVMEFLDGESLTKMIARGGSIPTSTAMHIVGQIASALEAAHARGIVHRDLKPDNIYLVKQGSDPHFVKVLDFGIAKVGGASSKLTKTGMIFGTPHYMSPEQASGQAVDGRTDIYALGVIMYEMFTGKVPFDGDTFMGILSKHMFEQPLPPSQVHGKGLGAVEDIILRALAKKPDERYASMAELQADLQHVATGGNIEVGRRGGIVPPGNLADALEPPSRTEMRLSAPTRQRSGGMGMVVFAIATVALLAIGLGVGAVVFYMTGSPAVAAGLRAPSTGAPPAGPAATASPPVATPGATAAPATTTSGAAAAGAAGEAGSTPAPSTPAGATAPAAPGEAPAPGEPPAQPPTPAEPAAVAAPAPPPLRVIEIGSDPAGAEVVIDGAIVGNTPVQLPAPREGERVAEIRMRGYESATVMITTASPDALRVSLTQLRTSGSTRPRRPDPAPAAAPTAAPQAPTQPPPRRSTEVVDPWAN